MLKRLNINNIHTYITLSGEKYANKRNEFKRTTKCSEGGGRGEGGVESVVATCEHAAIKKMYIDRQLQIMIV